MSDLVPIAIGFDTSILAGQVAPSSIEMYKRDFKVYLAFAGNPENALQSTTLARWRTYLASETTMSPNTINRMLSAVKRLMAEAASQGYTTHENAEEFKRIHGVKVSAMKDRVRIANRVRIDKKIMRAIIDSIETSTLIGLRNKALFTTLASSGLRIGEFTHLKKEQLRKVGNGYFLHMYAEQGKNQTEDRDAHVSPEAVRAIENWLAARPVESEYIFTSFEGSGGSRALAKPISPQGAWSLVKEITEPFIPNVKPHDFRRFVGTNLIKNKGIQVAKKALGHKKIETTVEYDLTEIEVGATDDLF